MPHDNDHGKISILESVAGAICGVVVVGKGRSIFFFFFFFF